MRSVFPVHGRTLIDMRDAVVRCYIEGPWNAELVHDNHQRLLQVLTLNPLPRWAMMVVPVGSAMCGPEAMRVIHDCAASDCLRYGRCATAWVLHDDVEGAAIMRPLIERAYDGVSPLALFDDEDRAERWLNDQLLLPSGAGVAEVMAGSACPRP